MVTENDTTSGNQLRRVGEMRGIHDARQRGTAGQYAAVDEMLTGRENLQLVGWPYHLGRAERRQRAGQVLEQFQLAGAADRPVRTYSGGMRRVALPADLVTGGGAPNDKNLAAWPAGRRARCPARPECLAFALRTGQVHGIWGGLTKEERHQAATTSQGT